MRHKIKYLVPLFSLIVLFLMAILVTFRFYLINKTTTNLDYACGGIESERQRILNTKYDDAVINGVGDWIIYAIEDELDWNNLPLTENFKSKYKNGIGIMPEKNNYRMFSNGRDHDINENNIVSIFAYYKPDFFDFNNENPIKTVYYYRYKISQDNKIDDIELIKKEIVSATTGEQMN